MEVNKVITLSAGCILHCADSEPHDDLVLVVVTMKYNNQMWKINISHQPELIFRYKSSASLCNIF